MACFHRLRPGEQIAELRRQLTEAKASGYRACLCGALVAGVVDGPDAIACPECGSTEGVLIEAAWEANRRQLAEAHAATQEQVRVAFEYEQAWRQALVAAATAQASCAAMRGEMDKALTALDERDYDTVRYWLVPVDDSDNPCQPYIDAMRAVKLLNKLREPECASVEILCPNPEFEAGRDHAICVNRPSMDGGEWHLTHHRYEAETLLDCLEQAAKAAGVEQ